jgi:hypothetical protein
MVDKLEKADRTQCQAMIRTRFALVGLWRRCTEKPVFIARETIVLEDDGLLGEMSMCEGCKTIFHKEPNRPGIVFERIKP